MVRGVKSGWGRQAMQGNARLCSSSYPHRSHVASACSCTPDRAVDGEAPAAATGSWICRGVVNCPQPVKVAPIARLHAPVPPRCQMRQRCRTGASAADLDSHAHTTPLSASLTRAQERLCSARDCHCPPFNRRRRRTKARPPAPPLPRPRAIHMRVPQRARAPRPPTPSPS